MPAGGSWFVLNAREAQWFARGRPRSCPGAPGSRGLPQLGLGLNLLWPGEPMATYHWETDREDFLVLAGEALLVIEGEARPLRQWDFVHCPPGANHVIIGSGDGPCIVCADGAL